MIVATNLVVYLILAALIDPETMLFHSATGMLYAGLGLGIWWLITPPR